MSRAPAPRDVRASMREAILTMRDLADEYEWVYNAAFTRPKRAETGGKRVGDDDPTGDAAAMTSLRSACIRASRKMEEAVSRLASALGTLEEAQDHLDSHSAEPIGPRLASPSDLSEARAAKARRMARREGWGDG